MTNPTTPFSWQMPTASDLVTDLPADFETFGQAVATSMADLLGGTTDQVLSKASNTDMDFTWKGGAWTSYTPTITANTGSFTTVSGTGLYSQIGKVVFYTVQVTITTNGTAAGNIRFTLPLTAKTNDYVGTGRENAVTGVQLISSVNNTLGIIRKYDNSYPGGTGYQIVVTGMYEAA
jgi:hypothetical protein